VIKKLLAHPLTRGMDIDAPETTELRRHIIQNKAFLRHIYEDWYGKLVSNLPSVPGAVVELGSGGGFLKNLLPDLIASEIFFCRDITVVLDGCSLPFRDSSLRAVVLVDVLHHIPDVRSFFQESQRCLAPGGRILLIEPWTTSWSKFIYQHFHHEPFRPEASEWSFPPTGPLSGANGALPWIVFSRDRQQFEQEFPELAIQTIEPFMPFRYLISGGVSMRTIIPGFASPMWRTIEEWFGQWRNTWSMFAFVMIQRA
jgi:SAM-dependent methyltransferase